MKKTIKVLLAVAGLFTATAAVAGMHSDAPVSVNATSRYAWGALSSTHNSADTISYMYCYVSASSSGTTEYAYCGARDAAATFVGCSTTNPALVDVVKTVGSDSYLYFNWDASGACTSIYAYQLSYISPKSH